MAAVSNLIRCLPTCYLQASLGVEMLIFCFNYSFPGHSFFRLARRLKYNPFRLSFLVWYRFFDAMYDAVRVSVICLHQFSMSFVLVLVFANINTQQKKIQDKTKKRIDFHSRFRSTMNVSPQST